MKPQFRIRWIVILSLIIFLHDSINAQTNFIWGKQFGTDKEESGLITATDQSGNVYIAGNTNGALANQNYGKSDAFITKLDSAGNIIWNKQLGTKEDDRIFDLKIDRTGNLYATGYTQGVLTEKSFGKEDIIVVKLNNVGNIEWQKQYGSDSAEVGNAIYVDNPGNIYVTGATRGLMGNSSSGMADCFILKLDTEGNKLFVSQFGTSTDDVGQGIAGDLVSNIYLAGATYGDLAIKNKGKSDAFFGKFDNKGEQIKVIQFGTDNYDGAGRIAIDKENNIYLGGSTGGDMAGKQLGEGDAYITRLSPSMDIMWIQQFGTTKWDGVLGLDINEEVSDNILVSGCQNWPTCQSYIRMYSKDGTLLWIKNFVASGKNGGTCGKGVCMDSEGNIYHTGLTGGNLFNTNLGEHDIFIVKQELDNPKSSLNNPNSVSITYLANDGFLISSGAESVLIDALFDKGFGRYDVPSEQLRKEITEGKTPFNKVALYLVTHRDSDHFYAPYVIDFLKNHSETQFISSGQVTESLLNESNIKKQIISISKEIGGMVDTTIGNIPIKIYRVKHLGDTLGNRSTNLAYLITLNNLKILHIGDGPFDFNKSYYEEFHLDKEKIDILFLEYFGQSDAKKQFVREVINPKYIIVKHLPPNEVETESKNFLNTYPNAFVFKTPMESKTFKK